MMTLTRVLVLCEFTASSLSHDGRKEKEMEAGDVKLQRFCDDMVELLVRLPQRSRLIGLFFHQYDGQYHMQMWVLDHESRRRTVVEDCFGDGLSTLVLFLGVLTHCDPSRLGILPAYKQVSEQVHSYFYLSGWRLSLTSEMNIGAIEKGSPVTFSIDDIESWQDYIFGRSHTIFACSPYAPFNQQATPSSDPAQSADATHGAQDVTANVQRSAHPGQKRRASEDEESKSKKQKLAGGMTFLHFICSIMSPQILS